MPFTGTGEAGRRQQQQEQQEQQQQPHAESHHHDHDHHADATEPVHSTHLTEQASWLDVFSTAYVFLYENACQTWTRSHRLALPPSSSPSSSGERAADDNNHRATKDHFDHNDEDRMKSPMGESGSTDLPSSSLSLDMVQVLTIFVLILIAIFILSDDESLPWDGNVHDIIRSLVSEVMTRCRNIHTWFHPVSDIPLLQ